MKILDVCAFYSPQGGGVRTYIDQKIRLASQLGHEVVIVAPGDEYAVLDRGPGARIVTTPSPRFPLDRKYGYFADEQALHAILDAEAPDVVEVSSPWRSPLMVSRWQGTALRSLVMHADPLAAYAYRWFGPVFSTRRIDRQFNRYWDHLRYLGGHYDVTVCANRSLAERLRQGGVRGVAVHPLGIEAETFSPNLRDEALRRTLLSACGLDGNARLLVAAGRLAPEKRWPMVVEAVAAASRRVPVGLVLFGEGRERRAIQRAIGGNPHVRLFEPIRDRKAFAATLASADALIHGCEAETFCMVAAEARASGTPVIVPDRGGAAEHARDGAGMRYEAASVHAASDAIAAFCLERRSGLSIGSTASHVAGDVISHTDHFARLFAHYEMLGRMRAAA